MCNDTAVLGFARSDHLQDDHIPGQTCTKGHVCRLRWSTASRYDVLVLNRGIHIVPDARLAHETLELASRLRAMPPTSTLIWRTTVPGHENCTEASQPLAAYAPSPGHMYGWDQVERQNEIVFSTFESVMPGRLHYLDAYELSLTRADRHRVQETIHVSPTGRLEKVKHDCLHYCLPGPPDDWNMLLKIILRGAANDEGAGYCAPACAESEQRPAVALATREQKD